MQMIMTRVAAMTMRAAVPARPVYGASSSLRKFQNNADGPGDSEKLCASVVISTTANDDNRRLADPKQLRRRILDTDTDWISRCQMHPVERSLYVGEAGFQTASNAGIRSDAEPDAIHDAGEAHLGFGQYVNIRLHPWRDAMKRA